MKNLIEIEGGFTLDINIIKIISPIKVTTLEIYFYIYIETCGDINKIKCEFKTKAHVEDIETLHKKVIDYRNKVIEAWKTNHGVLYKPSPCINLKKTN